MNELNKLKEMLTLDRKTLRIEDIAPLVQAIEKMYIKTASKLSTKDREAKDWKIKHDQAQAHVLRLSGRIAFLHMSPEEQAEVKKPGKKRRKKVRR